MPDVRPALIERLHAWLTTRPGAKLTELPPRTAPVGGLPCQAYLYDIVLGDRKTHETLMAIVTPIDTFEGRRFGLCARLEIAEPERSAAAFHRHTRCPAWSGGSSAFC